MFQGPGDSFDGQSLQIFTFLIKREDFIYTLFKFVYLFNTSVWHHFFVIFVLVTFFYTAVHFVNNVNGYIFD